MAGDNGGWIKLYWKTKQSIAGSNFLTLGVWSYILLSVARTRRILPNGHILEPGELLISVTKLAAGKGVTRKVLDRLIDAFESEGMINVIKRDRNGTHLSVCNWGTYQLSESGRGAETETQWKRNGNETETKRKRNVNHTEIPKIPKIPKSPKKGGTATTKFQRPTVDEVAAYCAERGNSVDASRFVDYYAAQGWKLANGRPMADWKAAVRGTWEAKAANGHTGADPRGNMALIQGMIEGGLFDEQ